MPMIHDTRDDDLLCILTLRNGGEQALSWIHNSPQAREDARVHFAPLFAAQLLSVIREQFPNSPRGRFVIME